MMNFSTYRKSGRARAGSFLGLLISVVLLAMAFSSCQRVKFPYAGFSEKDAKREAPQYTYEPQLK